MESIAGAWATVVGGVGASREPCIRWTTPPAEEVCPAHTPVFLGEARPIARRRQADLGELVCVMCVGCVARVGKAWAKAWAKPQWVEWQPQRMLQCPSRPAKRRAVWGLGEALARCRSYRQGAAAPGQVRHMDPWTAFLAQGRWCIGASPVPAVGRCSGAVLPSVRQ